MCISVFAATACGGNEEDGPSGQGGVTTTAARPTGDPFKIGFTGDLSGGISFLGVPGLAGLRTYFDHVNRTGGVHGRPLEVVALDSKTDLALGTSNVQQLGEEGVIGIFWFLLSTVGNAAATFAAEDKIPYVAGTGADKFGNPAQDFLYQTNLPLGMQAQLQAQFLNDSVIKGRDGTPRVALLAVDSASADDWHAAAIAETEKRGWEVVADQRLSLTAADLSGQVGSVARSNPDYVLSMLLEGQIVPLVQGLRERGVKAPVVEYFGGTPESVFKTLNDDAFYGLRDYVVPTDPTVPAAAEMRQRAEAANQTKDMTNYFFTHAYVWGNMVTDALKACGPDCDGPGLDKALGSLGKFDAKDLAGPMGVSAQDHRFVRHGRFYRWDAGRDHTVAVGEWMTVKE